MATLDPKCRLVAALALVLGIFTGTGSAYGDSYAISYNNLFNGTVIEADPAAIQFSPSITTSADDGSLNGSGPSNSAVGVGPQDAAIAIGTGSAVAPAENSYTAVGSTGTNYSYGDAQVVSVQTGGIPPDTTIQAVNIAEGNVSGSDFAESRGNNSSASSFEVVSPSTITFDLDAAPYMEVVLGAEAQLGSKAEAILEMTVVITNAATGAEAFRWAPNGNVNNADITGTVGGVEVSDAFTLNTTRTQLLPGTQVYDPTLAGPPVGNLSPGAWGHFTAVTNVFPVGNYNLTLQGAERQSVILSPRVCGDGILDPGESCDPPGAEVPDTGGQICREDCSYCGDGILDSGEECDDGNNLDGDGCSADCTVEEEELGCRLTGGGVAADDTWDGTLMNGDDGTNHYQFGGQAGANTALPPQPSGEWEHHQQRGPAGAFSFHAGTASAPAGTEIVEVRCSDPGGCTPSGNPPSPNKQLDFDCVGTFSNIGSGKNAPTWLIAGANVTAEGHGSKTFDGTFHYCEVNVDDNGEGPDADEPDTADCPADGFGEKGSVALANCDCPDFYRITIYNGVAAANVTFLPDGSIDPTTLNTTDVLYEVEGYLKAGNGLQLHSLTGFDTH